jgi:hypothetical protein
MAKGTYCYITAPTNSPCFYFEGTYSEDFKNIIKRDCLFPKWDGVNKRWVLLKQDLNMIKNKAQQHFDRIYYATDGDYDTIGDLDYNTVAGASVN